ncbi:MAG: cupin domain-containing protein [Saprospiraceae bacterium]|nr:cupin domain-containing protein [Saprospiraceae bacterium]
MKRRDFLTTTVASSATMPFLNSDFSTSMIMTDKPLIPFHLPFTEPLQPGPGGIDIRTLIRSSQTNMQYSSTETAVIPKLMGPPPHSHKALDEIILVTEGTATLWVDEKLIVVKPNEWYFMPRKSVHTFWNSSDQTLRFIGMYFQQNFEDYLEELFS